MIRLLIIGILFFAASTVLRAEPQADYAASVSNEFLPMEPEVADSTVEVVVGGTVVRSDIRLLADKEQLQFLTTTRSSTRMARVGNNGKLTFLSGTITGDKGRYAVFMDHAHYFVEPARHENGDAFGRYKTGIGLRLVASIETRKRGIDLGSIFKIGLAAGKNEMSGSLEVLAFGISGPEISTLLPGIMATIDESSIQRALESMAAVRAKFWEEDTSISPTRFAIEATGSSNFEPARMPRIERITQLQPN